MKNWSTSTRVTILIVIVLIGLMVGRSAHYTKLARTIAHEVATPRSLDAARGLIVKKRLARIFKDRPDQAKKQAIRTAQVFAADRTIVAVEDHHIPMAEAAAGAMVEFLSDLELPVRATAADALRRMGKPAVRPLIDVALTSPDKDVRSNASLALQAIGEVAVPEMIDAISGGSPSQKIGCAGAIGKLKSPRAIDGLVGALAAKEEEVRLACRDALVAMQEAAVKPLITALGNKDAFTRQHACEALGEIGDKAAAKPLLKNIDDDNRLVRLAATYAVGKVHDKVATVPLVAKMADKDREIREAAAVSLGQISDQAAVPTLIVALNDSVDKVREQAASALGRLAPADAASLAAIQSACNAADEGTRGSAVFALGRIGNPSTIPAIAGRLAKDPAIIVRQRAARALGELKSADAIPALLAAFSDKDWRVNYAAQEGLALLGKPAVAPLITLLGGQDALLARYARKSLVRMDPAPVAELVALTAAGNASLARVNGTIALGEIGAAKATAALEKLKTDADPLVAEAAKQALIVRGTPAIGAEAIAPAADTKAAPAPAPAPAKAKAAPAGP
ncbi:MAG: HEAT repeat domain-containing protein [Armatimonadetes bacterium]|nr:HEAT repeat domain-containing protein [Armatimonadota bacterium]